LKGTSQVNERVLITGSSGFVGRSLVPFLQQMGYIVAGLDANQSPEHCDGVAFYKCDLLDRDKLHSTLREFLPTVVVHLAARTDLDETQGIDGYAANTVGTQNVVDAIIACGTVTRVLFTSSQLVCAVGYVPTSDTDYQPMNFYGKSKVISEQIVRRSMPKHIAWCLLRPTTIWGEGMSPHYQRFLGLLAKGRYFHIGNGRLLKSYGYVGNSVSQYSKFIAAPQELIIGKTFYIADYSPLSLREWIDALSAEISGRTVRTMPISIAKLMASCGNVLNMLGFRRFPFNSFRVRNILTEYTFDLSPTERVCGPLPYTMQQGVKRTAHWFKRLNATRSRRDKD
jgi:GlcNAc-P-P-Und epimerase